MARSPWWIGLIVILALAALAIGFVWTCPPVIVVPAPTGGPAAGNPAPAGTCAGLRGTIVTEGVKLAVQLALIGVIGGLAKFLLDSLGVDRADREARLVTRRAFLSRLHAAKARVERAREILRASDTLQAYRAQVDEVIGARSDLEALAQDIAASGKTMKARASIRDVLRKSQDALTQIIEEWTVNDRQLAPKEESSEHQAEIARHLRGNCPALRDLREAPADGAYRRDFLRGVDKAAEELQHSILEGR